MAGANGEEKCIGRLTLDIEDIERKVEKINSLLEGIGSGIKVDLSGAISKEVDKQIGDVQKRVEAGAKEIETTISNIKSTCLILFISILLPTSLKRQEI